jgi:Holliday junction DNA helicase RuvA
VIGRLRGTLLAVQPPLLLVDVHGVGYEVEVPLSILDQLPSPGQPIELVTHLQVSDSAQVLYGFTQAGQRSLFRKLMKVSGVGARLALAVLSGISPAQFSAVIQAGDVQALTRVPGIGKKTAERLVMEMRDQLDLDGDAGLPGSAGVGAGGPRADAAAALAQLGYKPAEIDRVLRDTDGEGVGTEELIRAALKQLGGGRA